MGSGFARRKKQARMIQEQFSKLQDQLKETRVSGAAGNGLVTVTLTGDHELVDIKIKPECVDRDDIEGLEDLIRAAHADAAKKLQDDSPLAGMSSLGGLSL
jgi:nucleoid-associated protein EbfC